MTFPYGTPTTIVRRVKSGQDSFGNDIFTRVTEDVAAQAFDPGGSTEQVQGQDVVTTQQTVYYPPGTDVSFIDAVIVAGNEYEVDGIPNAPSSPFTSWAPGVIVRLRRTTG